MKQLALFFVCFYTLFSFSQIGIGTTNPQGILHIDGANDNPTVGLPSTIQQQNDFVILPNGNTGISTTTPTQNLDVNGNVRIQKQIFDGNNLQGASGQVLTSDGTKILWTNNLAITPSIQGVLSPTGTTTTDMSVDYYTGSYIDIPVGRWCVKVQMILSCTVTNVVGEAYWVRTTFSDSSISSAFTTDLVGPVWISGTLCGPNVYDLINGFCVINNTSGATKRYYYWKAASNAFGTGVLNTKYLINFGTALWGENIILADPIN